MLFSVIYGQPRYQHRFLAANEKAEFFTFVSFYFSLVFKQGKDIIGPGQVRIGLGGFISFSY